MVMIEGLPLWQDFGFGALLIVLATVGAELLARHVEADAACSRFALRGGQRASRVYPRSCTADLTDEELVAMIRAGGGGA